MKRLLAVLAFVALLAACATDASVRTRADELPGTYYSGDGLGRNVTVVLDGDGTFASDWQGCLGLYGTANGTWELRGDRIVFHPVTEDEMLAGHLAQATTVRYAGRLGFARGQDVARGQIGAPLLFLRQAPAR